MNAQRYRWTSASLVSLMLLAAPASADGKDSRIKESSPTRVLASVGEILITQADVDLSLGRAGRQQNELPPIPQHMLMAAVEIIANQRRALETLKKSNKAVSDADVDKWLVDNSPPDLKLTADQALTARADAAHVDKSNYRAFIAFRLSWQNYVQKTVTEENLTKHFHNQQQRFDGTRFQVEHLWIAAPPGTSAARSSAHEKLTALRDKIVNNELDFAAAAEQLGGEEAKKAADAEWITGSGPLMPAIVDHVLKTAVGETSKPFDSGQAVHLVRVLAIEPGSRSFEQAKDDVRKHILLFLLEFLAKSAAQEMPLVWQGREAGGPEGRKAGSG